MISKIFIIAAITTVVIAQNYRKPYIEIDDDKYPPQPYTFAYDSKNEHGATQFRKEAGDSNGRVTGSYGYRDEHGVERIVEYVADENGYRANVKTNEPGTDNKSPANIELHANPLAIEFEPMNQRYTPRGPISFVPLQPPQIANSAPKEIYTAPRSQAEAPRRQNRLVRPEPAIAFAPPMF